MRKIFYKIFLFPFILNILFQYAETFIQIYIASTLGRFFNYAIESKTVQILKEALWFVVVFLVIMLIKTVFAAFIELQRQKKKYTPGTHTKCYIKIYNLHSQVMIVIIIL